MKGPWRARLVNGGLLVLAAVVMFDAPSAYSIVRGAPSWLALVVGFVVFPVLPVTWHLIRERHRRANPPAKPKTTGWERFAFRHIVVGVLVIGALIAGDRSRAWRGVRYHALWMIPTTVERLDPDSKLLDRVPATAEVIVWLRDTDDAHAMVSQVAPTSFGSRELVIALDGKKAMVLERGDSSLIELILPLYRMAVPGAVAPKVVELPGGIRMWSTGGWPASTGRATELIERMRRAPDSAFLVAAGRPRTGKMADEVAGGVGWLAVVSGELEAVGEVTTKSPQAAMMLWTEAERELGKERTAKPGTFACGSASDGAITLAAYGTMFVARAQIPVDQIRPLFLCLELRR